MRRVQARRAIAKVLLQNPNGITSSEIVDKLDPNVSRNSIRDGRHVSNLLRGAKGIMKSKENYNGGFAVTHDGFVRNYMVVVYKVTDPNELSEWVGGII